MRYYDGEYTSFFIAEEGDHGSLRGVGLAKHDRGNKTRYSYLAGPEERQWQRKIQQETLISNSSFEGWQHKTICLE